MTHTDTPENGAELFELAARIMGCDPIDILKVRLDPAGLVIIIATGQKYTFGLPELGALEAAVRAQLAALLGHDPAEPQAADSRSGPAPLPADRPRAARPKLKRGR